MGTLPRFGNIGGGGSCGLRNRTSVFEVEDLLTKAPAQTRDPSGLLGLGRFWLGLGHVDMYLGPPNGPVFLSFSILFSYIYQEERYGGPRRR